MRKFIPALYESGDKKRNEELYPLVAAGDRKAMDEMIMLNMALVKHKVDLLLNQYPQYGFLVADLISQGTIGLVQAVNLMAGIRKGIEGPVPEISEDKFNPTGFIATTIFYRLGELLDAENGIRVPGRSRRRKIKSGFAVPVKENSIESEYTLDMAGAVDPRATVDLLDEIYGCCDTDQEREIVRHRIEGRSDQEIADIIEISRWSVYMIRQEIEKRFKGRNDEYAD